MSPATRTRRFAVATSIAAAITLAVTTVGVSAAPPEAPGAGAPGQGAAWTETDQPDAGDNRHPSGRDRSVEPGGSGAQGQAGADPDDDGRGPDRSNSGLDQEGGPGGVDRDDQDGNNGCGNDDDFEDDNEGLCLGREGAPGQQPEVEVGEEVEIEEVEEPEVEGVEVESAEVESAEVERAEVTPAGPVAVPTQPDAEVLAGDDVAAPSHVEVLGVSVTRDVTPSAATAVAADTASRGTLPRTGAGLALLAALGTLLLGAGTIVARAGRSNVPIRLHG